MVYRSLHGLAQNYLNSYFERREIAYNLRDSENKLNVPLYSVGNSALLEKVIERTTKFHKLHSFPFVNVSR